MSKARLSTEWLSVCAGCHVAIVDLHEQLLKVLELVEIVRCPVLIDVKGYPDADIGLLTGAIRSEHDLESAHKMRESCKTLIAYGTCGVFGGISGAGSIHTQEEIFDSVYLNNPTTVASSVPGGVSLPDLRDVVPIDSEIEVDLYLTGCPPHPYYIFTALAALLTGEEPAISDQSVCAQCNRKMVKTDVTQIKRDHEGIPDPDTCFLSQGYICMGSLTLGRCRTPCPREGVPCTGCVGPTRMMLQEPNRDIRSDLAERMSRLTKIPVADIVREAERHAKTYYAFSMASPMVNQKPTYLIQSWIDRTGAKV